MRILLFTGKGGVGKTSLAAATGVRLAELNYRTMVMSIDPAHSLADCSGRLRIALRGQSGGRVKASAMTDR
jgi:anion-transporting  ArsA/GET3 family ATPase